MRTLLLKHTYTQNVKKKKMTVIFKKKRGKKEICSLFSRFVRVYEWWLKFFFSFLHFYSPVFSHLINNTEWMNGYWVLLKKKSAHTRFPRVPFTSFNKTSCSLWVRKRKKKFNFVPSSLSLTHYYYLILSVKCVCSFFFSRARWTTATACKLEAMFNHVLKLENVNIYI